MGEPHNKTSRLNEKLIASSKVSTNNKNVPIISKTGPSVVITDNATNEPLPSQHSDNDYNSDTIKTTDINIPNHNSINKTNHIQSVHNINSSSQQNTNNEPENYAFGKKSFAETILNSTLPKKENAIVFDSIHNIPQIEYIIAISKLTPPKNIKFASRITNNRFCIYLNDKNTVDFLVDNHPYNIINSHTTIKIRRLINPAKRIIISHVSPDIPNEYIISHLEHHKIQILSPITHINAGFNIPELAHIISFRRQVYIKPDDFEKLPKSILINLENTSHRIFLDDDSIHCFLCKRKGAQTDPQIMWNKIRSLQGRKKHNNIYLSTNSSLNTDPSSIAHLLGKYFKKNSSNEMYSHDFLRQNTNLPPAQPSSISPQNTHQTYLNSPKTIDDFLQALKKCTSKSTGPDNIPYSFIQNFSIDTLQVLLKIYNTIWNKNVIPQNWRNSIVIPISKPGKNKFSPEGYRPISLLNYLYTYRDTKHSENQYLGMISLDLMKAYDTTWKPHILNSLKKVLSQNQLFNFISNFLKTRTFQVRINQTLSNTFLQANGVPQGSTILVTLFLIAINNITQNISPPVYSTLYADDFNIYCSSKRLGTVQTHLQQAINNLIKWTLTSGFTFSPEKSQCTVFTRKRIQNSLNIKIDDYQLINNSTIKILGITFDKRCSWIHHINSLKNSTSPRLNIIKMLYHSSWVSKTHVLLTVYKSLILSKLDYGSFLWITANKSNTKKLDTIHNAGLRMSIGAYRSSPIPSIYNLAYTPPLEIRRLKITLNHELKLASTLPSFDFNPKFKTLSILLQENNLVISNLLTISPPLAP
ncbi:hypothetical protein QTP88_027140 [Uroleucon formosanum]